MLFLTPKNSQGEHHLLKVLKDGRIICDCRANLYNAKRDYASDCKHAKQFINNLSSLEEKGYEEIVIHN